MLRVARKPVFVLEALQVPRPLPVVHRIVPLTESRFDDSVPVYTGLQPPLKVNVALVSVAFQVPAPPSPVANLRFGSILTAVVPGLKPANTPRLPST